MYKVFNTTSKSSDGSCQLSISSEKIMFWHYFRNFTKFGKSEIEDPQLIVHELEEQDRMDLIHADKPLRLQPGAAQGKGSSGISKNQPEFVRASPESQIMLSAGCCICQCRGVTTFSLSYFKRIGLTNSFFMIR